MKFSTSFAALCAVATSLRASAFPLERRQSFSPGAIYFMTNMPGGNNVVTADIGVDGTLTMSKWFSTGGAGLHGLDGAGNTLSDPLFSQGAVQVHTGSGLLGVVNPGSNSVSLFQIDSTNPSSLTQIGQPISSGGDFPISLAFNQNATMLCVLNGGSVNGVKCLGVNATTGLTELPNNWRPLNIQLTTPPSGPLGSASQVIFTADQQNVVAAMKGNPTTNLPGFLASWSLTGQALSPAYTRIELPQGGGLPFSIGNIPGRSALFATDALIGTTIFDTSSGMSAASLAPATKSLAIPGQKAICWQAFSNKTGNFYVSDIMTDLITEINVNSNITASMVTQYPTIPGSSAIDLEVGTVNGNDYLYTLLPNATTVHVMSLNAPGQASVLQVLNFAQTMTSAGLPFSTANFQGMALYIKPTAS